MTASFCRDTTPSSQPPRLITCLAHRVRGAWHLPPQVSRLGLDEAEQVLSSIPSLSPKSRKDRGDDVGCPDIHSVSLGLRAPAGSCDFAGRRADHLARGLARGPVSKSINNPADEASHGLPAIRFLPTGICPPPVHLSAPGSDRGALSISPRGPSAKIIRASQHLSALSNAPTSEASAWCTEVLAWSSAIGGQL